MEPERWQQIDKLLEAVLEQEESQRAAFLKEACGGDEALRQEVESLLEHQSEHFMEEPAVGMAAEGLVQDQVQALVGKQMGSYKILSLLGKGGMGEVYRARDMKLEREVAIKVLPAEFTQDPGRLARFEREAKLLAALNHPNIAAIYGLEESDGIRFLVLELVEGETLAERVAKGPLPVEKALEVGRQIAEGVEAAHEKGVIHRDLKPANVKVTPEGKVKILDFGLAKAFEGETLVTDISQSPTLTEEMTRAGVILGTAAYMSPEQAKGKEVDKRADIFAFGAVLYELLSGKRTFEGETITETLAAVLKSEPDWESLPESTPSSIRTLLRRCLTKDVHDRLEGIANVRVEIKLALEVPTMVSPTGVGSAAQPSRWKRAIPWSIAVVSVVIAISIAFWSSQQSTSPPLMKFVIAPAPPPPPWAEFSGHLAISADGRHVLYRTNTEEGAQLYLRSLDDLVERPIPGTESALSPFFSPDGDSVGFFVGDQLKKVSLAGGSPITLCEARGGGMVSGSWSPDDTIVFSAAGYESVVQLYRVSASGGEPEILPTQDPDKGENRYHLPHILPGGKTVLFTMGRGFASRIAALTLETGEQKTLIEHSRQGIYVETGHLIYEQLRTGNLMAVLFDLETLEVTSDPVPVLQGVRQNIGTVDYALSDEGTLVYIPTREESGLVWVNRDGRTQRVTEIQRDFSDPRLSPDGTRLSVTVEDEAGGQNIWIYEIAREILTPFTVEGLNRNSIWSPDGKRLIFSSDRGGELYNLFWMPIDGSAEAKQLTTGESPQLPTSWSPDGLVAYVKINLATSSTGGADILLLPFEGERETETALATQYNERNAAFSLNGRWLAFTSDRSGQTEVYVKPYPGQGGIVQISTDGGQEPVWAHSGKELFYRTGDQMMVVSVQADTTTKAEKPRLLFQGSYRYNFTGVTSEYDVTADGQQFVMVKEETSQINVVLNWFEELKRLVPAN